MHLSQWSKSEVEYGRRVLNSGLEGVRSGREAFLHGRPLTPFFCESIREAFKPALVGACVAVATDRPKNENRSLGRTLTSGVLGGLIGFSFGMLWQTRFLLTSSAGAAVEKIGRVRDEHWLERHPIDYA